MSNAIVEFLNFLSPEATIADLTSASRRLVDGSDLVNCSTTEYTDSERDAIAEGILYFILNPNDTGGSQGWRDIVFESEHSLVGSSIEHYEFASWFSSDFLSDYCKATWERPFPEPNGRLLRIHEYYVAVLFRYSWCVRADLAAFPVSDIVEFAEQCDAMQIEQGRETNLPEILHLVVSALRACEQN
jgi:hypothetical protein